MNFFESLRTPFGVFQSFWLPYCLIINIQIFNQYFSTRIILIIFPFFTTIQQTNQSNNIYVTGMSLSNQLLLLLDSFLYSLFEASNRNCFERFFHLFKIWVIFFQFILNYQLFNSNLLFFCFPLLFSNLTVGSPVYGLIRKQILSLVYGPLFNLLFNHVFLFWITSILSTLFDSFLIVKLWFASMSFLSLLSFLHQLPITKNIILAIRIATFLIQIKQFYLMTDRYKTISYRNATYFGQLSSNKHQGVGMVIDENWLFCLAQWDNHKINGNCFMVFPDHRIFYGSLKRQKLDGVIVFVLSGDCRIYANYNNGEIQGNACIDFAQLKTILHVSGLGESRMTSIAIVSQSHYQQYQQKWNIISSSIRCQLKEQNKSFAEFINTNFSKKYGTKFLDIINESSIFIGVQGNTLGVNINPKNSKINSIGHYIIGHQIGSIGFKSISTISGDIYQQGNYLQPYSIIRYQLRPHKAFKISRTYFFRSMEFQNRFLAMQSFQRVWSICRDIGLNLANIQTQKYAQVLLQNPNPLSLSKANKSQKQLNEQQIGIGSSILSFAHKKKPNQYQLLQGIASHFGKNPQTGKNVKTIQLNQRDVSLQKIKQQVFRAAERRKASQITSKDIVRQFSPSQLKQTPKKIAERSVSPQQKKNSYFDTPQRYQVKATPQGKAQERVRQLIKDRNISAKSNSYFNSNNQARNVQNQNRQQYFKVDNFNHHGQKYMYKYYQDERKQSPQKKVSFKLDQNKADGLDQNISKNLIGKDRSLNRNASKSPNYKKAAQYADYYDSFVQKKKSLNKQRLKLQYQQENSDSLEYQKNFNRNNAKYDSKNIGQTKNQNLKGLSNRMKPSKQQLQRERSKSPYRIDKVYQKSKPSTYVDMYQNKKQHKQPNNPENINDEYRDFERIKISSYSKNRPNKKEGRSITPKKLDYQKDQGVKNETPIQKIYPRHSLFKTQNQQTHKRRKVFNYL